MPIYNINLSDRSGARCRCVADIETASPLAAYTWALNNIHKADNEMFTPERVDVSPLPRKLVHYAVLTRLGKKAACISGWNTCLRINPKITGDSMKVTCKKCKEILNGSNGT